MAAPKKALARRRAPPARWEVWAFDDAGNAIERVEEPTTKARATALVRQVSAPEGVVLRALKEGGTAEKAITPAVSGGIASALKVAAELHSLVRAVHARGQTAEVRSDPFSRLLIERLAAEPKVHRAAEAIVDLLSDFAGVVKADPVKR